jgi:hypothetical protein
VSASSSYAIDRANVVSDVIEGEAVIINLTTGTYYSLNETGSVLWGLLLLGPVSVSSAAAVMVVRYSGDTRAIQDAVADSLARLRSEGLVIETSDDPEIPSTPESLAPQTTLAPQTSTGDVPPFVTPSLEIHTDMQDFLLVDPIHEVDDAGRPAARRQR